MKRNIFALKHEEHWKWKIHKKSRNKLKIRGKLKKWLKKNICGGYVILRNEPPPSVWIFEDEEAALFKLRWI